MKRLTLALAALALLTTTSASFAQQPAAPAHNPAPPTATTPEMWFYQQQLQRYDDPKTAIRRRAEHEAAARQARIDAMKWYGYSNARPTANPTPWGSMYSPGWTSNSSRPFGWVGGTRTVYIPVESTYYQR